jgi:hypothetical protein
MKIHTFRNIVLLVATSLFVLAPMLAQASMVPKVKVGTSAQETYVRPLIQDTKPSDSAIGFTKETGPLRRDAPKLHQCTTCYQDLARDRDSADLEDVDFLSEVKARGYKVEVDEVEVEKVIVWWAIYNPDDIVIITTQIDDNDNDGMPNKVNGNPVTLETITPDDLYKFIKGWETMLEYARSFRSANISDFVLTDTKTSPANETTIYKTYQYVYDGVNWEVQIIIQSDETGVGFPLYEGANIYNVKIEKVGVVTSVRIEGTSSFFPNRPDYPAIMQIN